MVTLWGEVVIRSVGYVLFSLHVCVCVWARKIRQLPVLRD
jgi:hypothetical protein